jgi:hypothetical protein
MIMFEFCTTIDGEEYIVRVKGYTPGDPGRTWGKPDSWRPPSGPDADFDLIHELTGDHADDVAAKNYYWIVGLIEEEMCARADDEDTY